MLTCSAQSVGQLTFFFFSYKALFKKCPLLTSSGQFVPMQLHNFMLTVSQLDNKCMSYHYFYLFFFRHPGHGYHTWLKSG